MRLTDFSLLLSTLLVTVSPALSAELKQVVKLDFPADAATTLSTANENGPITFLGWDQPRIQIIATKTARSPEALERVQVDARRSGNEVRLATKYAPSEVNDDAAVSYEISVPRTLIKVTAKNENGAITGQNLDGRLELNTENGSIHGTSLRGSVLARTENGSIEAAISGTAGPGQITLETESGSIRLILPAQAATSITAKTEVGKIESDFSPSSIQRENFVGASLAASLGSSGKTVNLSTENGSIRIERVR